MTNMRIERDCLGEMEIPNDRYYGIQTIRNMKVSGAAGFPVVAYPDLKTVESTLSQIRRRRARGTSGLWPSSP